MAWTATDLSLQNRFVQNQNRGVLLHFLPQIQRLMWNQLSLFSRCGRGNTSFCCGAGDCSHLLGSKAGKLPRSYLIVFFLQDPGSAPLFGLGCLGLNRHVSIFRSGIPAVRKCISQFSLLNLVVVSCALSFHFGQCIIANVFEMFYTYKATFQERLCYWYLLFVRWFIST